MKKKKNAIILCLILLLPFAIYFSRKTYSVFLEHKKNKLLLEKRKEAFWALAEELKKAVADFHGESSVVIEDLNQGWEIAILQNKVFPSASLAKVPIMAACFYAANENRIDLKEKIHLKAKHKVGGSGLLKHEPPGKGFTVAELIELMIAESDNTAANILIEHLGFTYLNDTFKRLGLVDTSLKRKMMDFKSRRKGRENFTSARDLRLLLNEIYAGNLIGRDISLNCLSLLKRQKIQDRIPAKLPSDTEVAHKTGLEKGICHDAGIVFTHRGDFLICVLTKHNGKNSKQAKEFIAQIALLTYNYYQAF